jgi:hypothetical protein
MKMERVEITRSFCNIFTMQVCAVEDATDVEILDVCNNGNPAGTTNGWSRVIRKEEDYGDASEGSDVIPVDCAENPGRIHYLVTC